MGHDDRFAVTRQSGLNQAALVDPATRTVIVVDAYPDFGGRVDTARGVLPSFTFNGTLQRLAQTEAARLDIDLHFSTPSI